MRNVNADIDSMNNFLMDIKRHKESIISLNKQITYRLNGLGNSWRDKAYEKYKEEFIREHDLLIKKQIEFYELKIKDLHLKTTELEEFLNKMDRR